jgi:hypothetical protein
LATVHPVAATVMPAIATASARRRVVMRGAGLMKFSRELLGVASTYVDAPCDRSHTVRSVFEQRQPQLNRL